MLRFRFGDVLREAQAFLTLSNAFLGRDEAIKLERFRQTLEGFRDSGESTYRWEIPEASKIHTNVSKGGSDPLAGGEDVVGTFCCVWDIQKVPGYKGQFEVWDRASCALEILNDQGGQLLAWHMDLAVAPGSPGCYVHSQIQGVTLPRFPGIAISPFAAFEFLLAEIFHRQWLERVSTARDSGLWRGVQKSRMNEFLNWASKKMNTNTTSPWMAFKEGVPPKELFV